MAATIELPSTIEGVTVHRRDALVRRVADVGGLAVPTVAAIGPLPLTLLPTSVRAVVLDATGTLAPQAATARVAVEPVGRSGDGASRAPAARALEDAQRALDEATHEAERLQNEIDALSARLEPTPRRRAKTGEADLVLRDREPVAVERRLALLSFRQRELERLTPAHGAAQRRVREATRSYEEARDRLWAEHRSEGREHELVAVVLVALQGAGSVPAGARLEVTYLAAGASWRASHRLFNDGERSRLSLGAVVTQRTGEDWSGVTLDLATTEPSLQWQLPTLKPLRIGRVARPGVSGWRAPDPLPAELFADFDRAQRAAAHDQPPAPVAASAPGPLEPPEPYEVLEAYGAYGAAGGAAGSDAPVAMPVAAPLPPPMPSMPVAPPAAAMAPQSLPAAPRSASRGGLRRPRQPAPPDAPPPARAGGAADADLAAAPPLQDLDPDRPDDAVADLDRLVLPAPTGSDRGRPRPHAGATVAADHHTAMARSRVVEQLADDGFAGVASRAEAADGLACVYRAPAPVDIPSARAPSTLLLAEAAATVRDELVTVPHAATEVFRTLVFANPLAVPVVAGPLEVSGPAGYVGPAEIPTITPGAVARVGIGIEDGIRVERQVDHRDDAKGLVRSSRVLEHHVTIRLTNRLTTAATIVVRERVPTVPDTEDRAVVEELAVEPPWSVYRRDDAILRGGRQWTVTVEPSQVAELQARWQIVIPAKFELEGGNRR